MTTENKKGFTLIELLVVVLIIGILASVALPQYQKAVAKTRVMRLLPLLKSIDNAQKIYHMANGKYASSFEDLDIGMPSGATSVSATVIRYNGFSCDIGRGDANTGPISAYCNDSSANYPLLEKYFDMDQYICWGRNIDFATAVCKSISGRTTENSIGSEYNGKSFYF